jgi:hypothetical protein
MANIKRSALATGFTVDLTALNMYNTTNFVEYKKLEAPKVLRRISEAPGHKPQASSSEPQASSDKRIE